jgi:hypothetical protein
MHLLPRVSDWRPYALNETERERPKAIPYLSVKKLLMVRAIDIDPE